MPDNISTKELLLFNLFRSISETDLVMLINQSKIVWLVKEEFIDSPELMQNNMYFLLDGVAVQGFYSNHKFTTTGIFRTGEFCGIAGLFVEQLKSNIIISKSNSVKVLQIPKSVLVNLIKSNTNFQQIINDRVLVYVEHIEHLMLIVSLSARKSVIELLKFLAINFGRYSQDKIIIRGKFTHTLMAELSNSSRQSVTQVMNLLRKEGHILYDRGKIIINDFDRIR